MPGRTTAVRCQGARVEVSVLFASLLCVWCAAVTVDDLMTVDEGLEVPPEDVVRAFSEVRKTQYLGSELGSEERPQERQQLAIWAAIACETYQHDLLFVSDGSHEADNRAAAVEALDGCLERASGSYVSLLRPKGVQDAPPLSALTVIDESRQLLMAAWAGSAFDVDSTVHRRILEDCTRPSEFRAPGTEWVVDTRESPWDAKKEKARGENLARSPARDVDATDFDFPHEQTLGQCLPACLFITRWCPLHPEVSQKLVREKHARLLGKNMTQLAQREWCLAQASAYWQWCGGLEESPLNMIFMYSSRIASIYHCPFVAPSPLNSKLKC